MISLKHFFTITLFFGYSAGISAGHYEPIKFGFKLNNKNQLICKNSITSTSHKATAEEVGIYIGLLQKKGTTLLEILNKIITFQRLFYTDFVLGITHADLIELTKKIIPLVESFKENQPETLRFLEKNARFFDKNPQYLTQLPNGLIAEIITNLKQLTNLMYLQDQDNEILIRLCEDITNPSPSLKQISLELVCKFMLFTLEVLKTKSGQEFLNDFLSNFYNELLSSLEYLENE